MGHFLSRSSPERQIFVLRQFLCSISKPVSSSRPALRLRRRAQKLSRLAVAPTLRQAPPVTRPHLDSFEHDGTLALRLAKRRSMRHAHSSQKGFRKNFSKRHRYLNAACGARASATPRGFGTFRAPLPLAIADEVVE